jgi:hypothetical protein
LQTLLGDGQLLHLPLPSRQLSLLVSQPNIPGIHVELTGQDLGTDVLQSLLLSLKVSITTVEAGLAGAQGLKLSLLPGRVAAPTTSVAAASSAAHSS